ncbi:MAG: tRNA (N(6)-L-threonylcarbamoyladenosine(37)-C(2))-methylthiotransferase MtaB [Lachnospiraceae bacterium]|nr:tRNA (N(6)-L-threonylcarbamoyladenosine(37)-C(2))-methylthiotransferase MtaB [Lachnospiraceae bacterium]
MEQKNLTCAFLTLGCKVNAYETDAMTQQFRSAGYRIGSFEEKADIYVVNTCTVTSIADRKSRQMLHRAKKTNPEAIVVAAGCYVNAAAEKLLADAAVDLVIGNHEKNQIVSLVEAYLADHSQMRFSNDVLKEREYETLVIADAGEKTRAYIKIQDGCNQFCTYCIIPYARGRIRSRNADEVVTEVTDLVAKGYKEVVLTGIHLSSYGRDKQEEDALLSLILRLCKIDGLMRIRLGSLEPRIITEQFVSALKDEEKFCPHFHLSLQSGCLETLKRMNRHYTPEEYLEKCQMLREAWIDPAITTDVIVGFPGETEEEFETTKAFLREAAFSQMHIFKYSRREGTKAAVMPNQVLEPVKNERSAELISLENEMRKHYMERFIGTTQKVLFEEPVEVDGVTYLVGHNERYLRIGVPFEEGLEGEVRSVLVRNFLGEEILLGSYGANS